MKHNQFKAVFLLKQNNDFDLKSTRLKSRKFSFNCKFKFFYRKKSKTKVKDILCLLTKLVIDIIKVLFDK